MFNGVEYVREICKQRKIAISTLERDCGFANGYLNPKKLTKLPYDRALIIAKYLNLSVDFLLTGEEKEGGETYYLNEETKEIAQEIYENKELRMLFDVSRKASPERLMAYYNLIKAMQDTEKGE